MTETITPLRRRGDDQGALARIDFDAVELLATGQAANLLEAQTEVILNDLRTQRDRMTTLLSDLRGREPTGVAQVDETNANLITAISSGLVQIDLFIARAQVFVAAVAQPELS